MNISRNTEKNFLESSIFVVGIIASLALYGCGESDNGSSQQSQEKATEMATSTMPEPAQPETAMAAEEPVTMAPEMTETPMVVEAPVIAVPDTTDAATMTEEPATGAMEEKATEVMEAPATMAMEEKATEVMEEPASGAMEEKATEVMETAKQAPTLSGGELYNTYCAICHKSGLNAAPKHGAKAYWTKRIAQGREVMYKHAIEGLRAMPPRGGIPSLSDADVKAAVDYMVKAAGGWGDS